MAQRYFSVLFFLIGIPISILAQADVHFSQFYETSILRNPALTGIFPNNYKVSVYYRNQWSSITNPFQTMQITGEYRFSLGRSSNDFISLGALAYNDEAGDLDQKISAFYGAINYNKFIDDATNSYLSFGFTGGYLQYSFQESKATFNNQFLNGVFDPGNPSLETLPTPKMSIYDLGAGVNYNFTSYETINATYILGLSAYHFTQPNFSYYKTYAVNENVRYNANADMSTDITDNILLQVHSNFALQGDYSEIIGGILVGWQTYEYFEEPELQIYAGVLYRYLDAVIPTVKIKYKHAGFGVSYDVNTSSLTKASSAEGGFELTMFITGDYPPSGKYRKTVCPRF